MYNVQSNNMFGIGFVLLACATMTISALLIRTIGKDLGSFEVVLIRCSFSLFYILVLNVRRGPKLFISPRPMMLGFRSLVLAVVVLGNFTPLSICPLCRLRQCNSPNLCFWLFWRPCFWEKEFAFPGPSPPSVASLAS